MLLAPFGTTLRQHASIESQLFTNTAISRIVPVKIFSFGNPLPQKLRRGLCTLLLAPQTLSIARVRVAAGPPLAAPFSVCSRCPFISNSRACSRVLICTSQTRCLQPLARQRA